MIKHSELTQGLCAGLAFILYDVVGCDVDILISYTNKHFRGVSI